MSSFQKLVNLLKKYKKTCTVVEQCCGGTISSKIMAQAGASSVFYGGSIAYNSKNGKALLLNDEKLHKSLLSSPSSNKSKDEYIKSKFDWTAKTSIAFCKALGTDYAVAEGGASGPTFTPDDMHTGFAVLSVAGKDPNDNDAVKVLKQKLVQSSHNHRQANMVLFADEASKLLAEVIESKEDDNQDQCHDKMRIVLDRATSLRSDSEQLKEMETRAKYVIVKKNQMLIRSQSELALLSYDDILPIKQKESNFQLTFLGLLSDDAKTPIFGIDIVDENLSLPPSFIEYTFADTRTTAPLLPSLENELALHMMAYANWQRKSSYCTSCGGPLIILQAGTAQQCTSCQTISWPRQDPSIIASISSRCGQRILLARSRRHPPKMHTVLAGFVEAGETFEAAVARETFEETGIRIDEDSVKYIGSQPWPFPQSCMIAFTATADDSQSLIIDEKEILEAKWFDREDVLAATKVEGAVMQHEVANAVLTADPSLNLLIPPKRVIARTLIDTWLDINY